jgi:hypothetical protein
MPHPIQPKDPTPAADARPGAFGYRGPGTDLGEDIRRGLIAREGDPATSEPAAHHAHEFAGPGAWGRRLREGWRSGLRALRPR